ncbi:hypothetical protein L195_g041293 [Trifolium pratense]|uniref:Uncharacterized protein n=1 Tax=Trifolium pratense TaxID=57577 RepID=A0A2K3M369_TRIPR|nr:hypothetical protein L195_g041293 [Trifolium pratense]
MSLQKLFVGELLPVSTSKSVASRIPESHASSKHKLVDTIIGPNLPWVAPEPRGIASTLTAHDPKLYTVVEDNGTGPANLEAHLPAEGKQICSPYSEDGFAMC